MNSSLLTSVLLAVLLVGGCSASPAAQGPAGPQGAPGANATPAPTSEDRDRDKDRDRGRDDARRDEHAQCPPGEHSYVDNGAVRCVRD